MSLRLLPIALLMTLPLSSPAATLPPPPDAAQKPHRVEAPHGAVRNDEYYWLRDDKREDKAMLDYLNAENTYTDAVMAPLKPLQETLYNEIVGRIKQDDDSVPYRERGWWYFSRFQAGNDYPVYLRAKAAADGSQGNDDQVLLDVNVLAKDKNYYNVGDMAVSQDNTLLAYAEDDNGRRQYAIRIKNLDTGELYPDRIEDVSPNLIWADDNRTLFYVENDPETLLSVRVKKHVLGTPASADVLVYEEKDDSFYMGISRTRDDRFICIDVESTVSTEMRCAPAADPRTFTVFAPRERDVEYNADHLDGRWVIHTNAPGADGKPAANYKLMTAASDATSRSEWKEWVPHRDDVFIDSFDLFEGFTAISERSEGLERIRLLKAGGEEFVKADEPAYSMGFSTNSEADTPWLRYSYTSQTTPATTYELNVLTGERRMLKQQPVIGYDASQYVTERVWSTARDGVKVPVSLVYKKGFERNGTAAMLQYAYGSYGSSSDPVFSVTNVSLLDRGMVYAIAHIRGGQEMGRKWYDDGKLFRKKNTFTDFIDVTDDLVAKGYAAKDRVGAYGGSPGRLVWGASSGMAADK